MRPPPVPNHTNSSCSTSKKTGSRKVWIQPDSGGQPTTMPSSAAGMASSTSGIVITLGDSWMWCCTSSEARHSPKKVMKMRRKANTAVRKAVTMPTAHTT